jgi:hypothetical protein
MSRTCAPLHVHLSRFIVVAIMVIYLSHSSDFVGPGHSFTKHRCVFYINHDTSSSTECDESQSNDTKIYTELLP